MNKTGVRLSSAIRGCHPLLLFPINYHIMKSFFTILLLSGVTVSATAQHTKYIQAVDEYVPAPGQFVNTLPEYEEGNTAFDMVQKCTDALADNRRGLVTLGAYGGYITFHFDHPVANVAGQKDFAIWGNTFYDSS